ncbi:MAG: DUF3168 domain-containing protein [Pseudomonadota bacterium]
MSADSQWAVQRAIYDQLRQDTGLTAMLAAGSDGIFDYVPANAPGPYCVIADMTASGFETQTRPGMRILCAVESYSRMPGSQEIKNLTAKIYDRLHHADLESEDHDIVLCQQVSARVENLAGGRMRKCRQVFEIITEPKL